MLESVPRGMLGQQRLMMPNNRNPRRENKNHSSCCCHPSPSRVPTAPHIAHMLSCQNWFTLSLVRNTVNLRMNQRTVIVNAMQEKVEKVFTENDYSRQQPLRRLRRRSMPCRLEIMCSVNMIVLNFY